VIDGQPFGLAIGAFIPVQAQPGHGRQDLGDELLLGAFPVGVLDPEDESPLIMPGNEPVEQRRVGAAQVEGAGGTGENRVRTSDMLLPLRLGDFYHNFAAMAREIPRGNILTEGISG